MGPRRQSHFVTVDARATYTGVAGLVTNSELVVVIQHGGTQAFFLSLSLSFPHYACYVP